MIRLHDWAILFVTPKRRKEAWTKKGDGRMDGWMDGWMEGMTFEADKLQGLSLIPLCEYTTENMRRAAQQKRTFLSIEFSYLLIEFSYILIEFAYLMTLYDLTVVSPMDCKSRLQR